MMMGTERPDLQCGPPGAAQVQMKSLGILLENHAFLGEWSAFLFCSGLQLIERGPPTF